MRLLQLSDPHLLADPMALCRGRLPWLQLGEALRQARLSVGGTWGPADLLLISGDLCHDDSWLGYAVLRDLLSASPCCRGTTTIPSCCGRWSGAMGR
jgi:Icc protein